MTKHELVDKEKVENITWGEPSYTDALNVLTEVRDKIRELPAITEQEIVKPYLEKLRADIDVAYYELDGYDPDALATFASRIDDLIDNLISEQED